MSLGAVAKGEWFGGQRSVLKYFSDSYTHKVEPNGRVSIPSEYRKILESLGSTHVVVLPQFKSPDAHVVLSQAGHEKVVARVEAEAKALEPKARTALKMKVTSNARAIAMDDGGRIKLSPELRDALGITNEIVFAGDGSTFELWHPDKWVRHEADHDQLGTELAEAFDLGGLH